MTGFGEGYAVGCYRCGARQVDPVSGPSLWRRAVVAGEQVLVCPDCQVDGWTDGLDRCRACGSTVLVKRLGEVVCRACGATGPAVDGGSQGGGTEGDGTESGGSRSGGRERSGSEDDPPVRPAVRAAREALADDVAAALDRVLRDDRR